MRSLTSFHVLNESGATALVFTFDDDSVVKALQDDDSTLDAVAAEVLPCDMPETAPANAHGWWTWWADVEEEEEEEAAVADTVEEDEPEPEDTTEGDNPFTGPEESPIQAAAEEQPPDQPQAAAELPTRAEREIVLMASVKSGGCSVAQLRKRATGPLEMKGAGKMKGGRAALVQAILDREAELGMMRAAEAIVAPEPAPVERSDAEPNPMAAAVAFVLDGKIAQVKTRIAAMDDLIQARACLLSAKRKGVKTLLRAKIEELEAAIREPEPTPVPVIPVLDDQPTLPGLGERPELGGGIGTIEAPGEGTELGGGFGGEGTELGGNGLGDGSGEVRGGLAGEGIAIGESGPEATAQGVKHREGAGCKQPDKVNGWESGKVMCVLKKHRGEFAAFGQCEYRVRCEPDGGYRLTLFQGNRTDITEGQYWGYVSEMLTDLMGIARKPDGKPVRHHRMTLKRWFRLGMGKSAKEAPAQ